MKHTLIILILCIYFHVFHIKKNNKSVEVLTIFLKVYFKNPEVSITNIKEVTVY